MPQRSRQIVWTTRNAREPWHGQNTIQVVVCLLRLDLGQHNHEVFVDLLGMSEAEVDDLTQSGALA